MRVTRRACGAAAVRAGFERRITGLLEVKTLGVGVDAVEDKVLAAQLATLSFVRPHHVGVDPAICRGARWAAAQTALRRLAAYSSPLDKMCCVGACCDHLGTLLHVHDSAFISYAALAILHAAPRQLHSQLEYIVRFVHPDKLWESNLGGALSIFRAALQWLAIQDPATLQQ